MVCPPVQEIIHSLKLAEYLLVQVNKPWYNYYLKQVCISSYFNGSNTAGLFTMAGSNSCLSP